MSLEAGAASLAHSTLAVSCGAWASAVHASLRLDPAIPNIFSPASTPADSIYHLSLFVLILCAGIFITVFSLLVYALVKFRRRADDDGSEPPQIYGSNQMELAWTVIPIVIVVVLFLATARVIHAIEDAKLPPGTLEVIAIGHQFWWEFQYPQQGFVTANELHVPVGSGPNGAPTHIRLLSADTDHSFWVPQLAGKTDLIPNHPNEIWIEPHETGVYVGQCAQYCGVQHAKMLLRVIVESPDDFQKWATAQKNPAAQADNVAQGRQVFESTACVNCHTVAGTECARKIRSRPDAPDESRNHCRRRGARTRVRICVPGSRTPTTLSRAR